LSGEDLDQIDNFQNKLEQAVEAGDVQSVGSFNHQIHRAINKASGSQRLTSVLKSTVNYVPLKYFEQIPGWAEASAHDHAPILKALRTEDANACRETMSEHIRHIGTLLIDHLDQIGRLDPAS
jgi:DNA-binding GntR family transcriptional regulator